MKKLVLYTMACLVCTLNAYNQENDSLIERKVNVDGLVQVDENGTTTTVKIADKQVLIIRETEDGVTIDIDDNNVFKVSENENGVTIKIGEEEILSILNDTAENTELDDEDLEEIIEEIAETIEHHVEKWNENIDIRIDEEQFSLHSDNEEILELLEDEDKTSIWIGDDELVSVSEGNDTTKIRVKNKEIKIIEDENGNTSVKVNNIEQGPKKKKFKGHYQGLDWGFNDFVNSDYSMSRNTNDQYMDMNTTRSETVGLNILQYSFGLWSNQFGFVTGLGFQFSDYFFSGNNSLQLDSLSNIVPLFYDVELIKSKLSVTYLDVPLLFEAQFPNIKRSKRVHIAAGVVGGIKLNSFTKVVYREDGNRQKEKEKGDFNIRPLRYGVTARVGYKALNLFATYYPQSFFEKGKGPELYPFTIGFTFNP